MKFNLKASLIIVLMLLSGCSQSHVEIPTETEEVIQERAITDELDIAREQASLNESNIRNLLVDIDSLDESNVFYATVINLGLNSDFKILSCDDIKSIFSINDTDIECIGLISSGDDSLNRIYYFNNAKLSTLYSFINEQYNQLIQINDGSDLDYMIFSTAINDENIVDGISYIVFGNKDFINQIMQ